jgi:hypothetical protein
MAPIKIKPVFTPELIAPCGMNCAICLAHLREKNICFGCNSNEGYKAKSCSNCLIKNCEKLKRTKSGFCYDCEIFPCARLKNLDKRYRTKYHMSMIGNLEYIEKNGTEKFLKVQKKGWTCPKCGGVICCHNGFCFSCGPEKLKGRVRGYWWDDE